MYATQLIMAKAPRDYVSMRKGAPLHGMRTRKSLQLSSGPAGLLMCLLGSTVKAAEAMKNLHLSSECNSHAK